MAQTRQIQIGYKLTSEEFSARALVRFARAAEEHGFSFTLISDHYHPWTDRQGQSVCVGCYWGHRATHEQAHRRDRSHMPQLPNSSSHHRASSADCSKPVAGRFFLGVGTGENLN